MAIKGLLLIAVSLGLSACTRGFIYTNMVQPRITNMQMTPATGAVADTRNLGVRVPLTRIPLSAQWTTAALGEAAKANGIVEVYYADVHRFSILGGLWQDSTLHIVGRGSEGPVEAIVPLQ